MQNIEPEQRALADDVSTQKEILNLLAYYGSGLSTWPFDIGSMTRLFLYFVIVPLTWAGAALIERLVNMIV